MGCGMAFLPTPRIEGAVIWHVQGPVLACYLENIFQYGVVQRCCKEVPLRGSVVSQNARILLVNLLQSSRSTFSRGNLLSFFAFKEGMLGTLISVLGGWPTVSARFLRLRSAKLLAVTLALEISYEDSLIFSSHKSKSRVRRING
jgi:hypothetical protein